MDANQINLRINENSPKEIKYNPYSAPQQDSRDFGKISSRVKSDLKLLKFLKLSAEKVWEVTENCIPLNFTPLWLSMAKLSYLMCLKCQKMGGIYVEKLSTGGHPYSSLGNLKGFMASEECQTYIIDALEVASSVESLTILMREKVEILRIQLEEIMVDGVLSYICDKDTDFKEMKNLAKGELEMLYIHMEELEKSIESGQAKTIKQVLEGIDISIMSLNICEKDIDWSEIETKILTCARVENKIYQF